MLFIIVHVLKVSTNFLKIFSREVGWRNKQAVTGKSVFSLLAVKIANTNL